MVGEMSSRGSVLRGSVRSGKCPSGKCPVGELSVQGNVRRGSVRWGSVSRGFVLGEVSVGEVSGRETVLQSFCTSLLNLKSDFHLPKKLFFFPSMKAFKNGEKRIFVLHFWLCR